MLNKYAIFQFGNNEKYEYKVIDLKENALDILVSEDSLIFKLCGKTTVKVSKYGNLPFGNFDLVLEQRDKATKNFNGLVLASIDEIRII